MKTAPHGGHGRERRRRRHRRGLGGHVQDRVAQPPELHRAVPGRRDRRRRHRARHHLDGRPPGRGHGRAALRRHRPPRHRPRRARRRLAASVLRQLPRPAEHRRRDLVRLGLPGQPARQRARGRRAAPRGPAPRQRDAAPATRSCCSAPAPAATASAAHRILASDTFADGGPTKRPAVQVGDPFAEKVLIECCLELFAGDLVEGIQDLGAAGISCATSELAANGDGGMRVDLDERAAARPHAHARGDPHEREPGAHDGDRGAREARRLPRGRRRSGMSRPACSARSPATGRLIIIWHGEEIVERRPATVAVDGPVYERPVAYPTWIDALQRRLGIRARAAPTTPTRCARQFTAARREPEPRRHVAGSRTSTTTTCMGNTALSLPRRRRHGPRRRAVRASASRSRPTATAASASSTRYQGAQARPRRGVPQRRRHGRGARSAVTDCLNFGSPENPEVMWQFSRGRRGPVATDASSSASPSPAATSRSTTRPATCRSSRRRSSACSASSTTSPAASRRAGRTPARTSTCSASPSTELERLGLGGHRARPPRRSPAGRRPRAREARSPSCCTRPRSSSRSISSAHDLVDGGLAQALAEARHALRRRRARVARRDAWSATAWMPRPRCSRESTGRVIVSVPREDDVKFRGLCEGRGYPVLRIGVTDAADPAGARGAGPVHRAARGAPHGQPRAARRRLRPGRRVLTRPRSGSATATVTT